MIELNPITVRKLFADNKDQADVLISLYKLVFPYWDQIKELKGYPTIHTFTWEEIATLFVAFDRIHHPDVISGGCWINRGFSIDDDVPHWKVSLDKCTVIIEPKVIHEMEEI